MPLPDERPRQSVANLIGRFEQQTKRQSLSGSPRSTNILSQSTGESVKEEAKERREWPPKAVASNDKLPPVVPPSSWSRRTAASVVSQPASPRASDDVDLLPAPPAYEPTLSSIYTPAIPSPIEPKLQQSFGSTVADNSASSAPRISSNSAPTPKLTPASPKTPTKMPVKSSPKPSSLGASTTQPLRPQYTGQSATSTSSTVRYTKSIPKALTTTPQSKTSSSAVRPKTPSGSRPKTPSGLFAPTAASLAKSRNVAPQLPTPTKKVTVNSSSAERLSKPTAASLARSTNAPAPASPARPMTKASSAIRGGETTGVMKPRVGLAPTKMKQEKAAATEADFSSKVAIPGAASIVTAAAMTGYNEIQRDGNGHGAEASDLIESVEVAESLNRTEVLDEMLREEPEDLQAESDVAGESEEELQEADTSVEPDSSIVHSSEVSLTQHDIGAKLTDSHITHHTLDISIPGGEVIPEDEVRPTVQSDSDIEDIVNLLEMRSSPKSRPKSIASIPDEEVDEIPDEE